MADKIKITLRKKKTSGNRESLYLDFYPPIISAKTGKPTRREFLKEFIYTPIKSERKTKTGYKTVEVLSVDPAENNERILHNNRVLDLAKKIFRKWQNSLDKQEIYSEYEKEIWRKKEMKKQLQEKSFINYFKETADKRNGTNYQNWLSALKYLQRYADLYYDGKITFDELDEKFCNGFRDFLNNCKREKGNHEKLSQNSVFSYYSKFKATLKQAFKDRFLETNLAGLIDTVKPAETQRNFLTIEELNQLVKTECTVPGLKNAALFSALTGLRFSDITNLTWNKVEFIKDNGYYLKFTQKKTKGIEMMPISKQAFDLLGEPKEPNKKIFNLVYSGWLNSQLFKWLIAAGITKEISFHCFRHSYAVLQLSKGTDIYTVSKMLGHRELKTTQIYAKIVDQTKRDASEKIILDL